MKSFFITALALAANFQVQVADPEIDCQGLKADVGTLLATVETLEAGYSNLTSQVNTLLADNTRLTEQVESLTEDRLSHVAFTAVGVSKSDWDVQDPLVFNTALLNQGDAYDNTNGRFVAPYEGVYSFSVTLFGRGQSREHIWLGFAVDGEWMVETDQEIDDQDHYESISLSAVFELKANQEVHVHHVTSGGITILDWGKSPVFSGFLVSLIY